MRSSSKTPLSLWLVAALCSSLHASAVLARTGDFEQPVDVNADRSEYDERTGTQVLEGNVVITQGTIRIEADRIVITLRNNQLGEIRGEGQPIRFSQENDQGEQVSGTASVVIYDALAGTLVLEKGATLQQPRQKLDSERIIFNSRTQTVAAEGGQQGRVSIRIAPPTLDQDGN